MATSDQIYKDQQDIVRWIENKLGSSELWGGRQASFMLSHKILVELETCFQELEPHVKLKIIQAIIHLSPKTIEAWKIPLSNLLEVARRDPDDWVETIADIYREFPDFGYIQCSSKQDSYFTKTRFELEKTVGNKIEACCINAQSVPDHEYLAPDVMDAILLTNKTPNTIQHFSKRLKNTKSSKMLEEMKKAYEQQNNPLYKKNHGLTSSFPIKIRSTAKKLNNNLPMRGIQSSNPLKMACGFTNESKKYQQRTLVKRTGGAMLIDIAELPKPNNRRKRNIETTIMNKSNEDSTGNLINGQGQQIDAELNNIKEDCKVSNDVPYQYPEVVLSEIANGKIETNSTNMNFNQFFASSSNTSDNMEVFKANNTDDSNANILALQHFGSLLKDANKLTQVSYNLISSFLNGNKNNPLQDKLGSLVTLPFSEAIEFETTPDCVNVLLVEVFFQMDYGNGEWKRLRKSRNLKPEELNQYQHLLAKNNQNFEFNCM